MKASADTLGLAAGPEPLAPGGLLTHACDLCDLRGQGADKLMSWTRHSGLNEMLIM